jgi:rod shape determining protein RodA
MEIVFRRRPLSTTLSNPNGADAEFPQGRGVSESPWYHRFPSVIVLAALALVALGLSAISRGDELYNLGEFAPRQRLWAALGAIVFVVAAVWPYQRLRWVSYPIYGGCLLLLVLVFFMPAKNYSHRWIPLGLMDFQPSELAKLAFVAALARYLMHRESFRTWKGLVIPFFMALVPIALILKEPDLGTSLLFLPVLFAMLFAAGARPRHLATVALLGVLASPFLWMQMSAEQKSRIVSVFTQKTGGEAPRGDGYHLHQSKRVLALGGVFGSEITGMPFKSRRAYHLPESRTDFVFCLIGERWGLIGSLTVLLLYCVLFARGLLIAGETRDPYGRLLAVGIVALMGSQVLINTAMTVGLLPITGMTLPLMSYGGSSLLTMCLALGLLVNIAMRPTTDAVSEPFQFAG